MRYSRLLAGGHRVVEVGASRFGRVRRNGMSWLGAAAKENYGSRLPECSSGANRNENEWIVEAERA